MRPLFIDFSSAFNTIIPSKLITKLSDLGIDPFLCNWILDFLTCRRQQVRLTLAQFRQDAVAQVRQDPTVLEGT